MLGFLEFERISDEWFAPALALVVSGTSGKALLHKKETIRRDIIVNLRNIARE